VHTLDERQEEIAAALDDRPEASFGDGLRSPAEPADTLAHLTLSIKAPNLPLPPRASSPREKSKADKGQ
jgi:hypothetical protein